MRWLYTLDLMVAGQMMRIESDGAMVTDLVNPVFDAANACTAQSGQ